MRIKHTRIIILFYFLSVHTDDGEQLCYTCQALVDTGTALIVGHKDVVNKIHQKMGANIHGTEASVIYIYIFFFMLITPEKYYYDIVPLFAFIIKNLTEKKNFSSEKPI